MDEIIDLYGDELDRVRKAGRRVRLIFVNGFQTEAKIIDFDDGSIKCRVGAKTWLVRCAALATIVLD